LQLCGPPMAGPAEGSQLHGDLRSRRPRLCGLCTLLITIVRHAPVLDAPVSRVAGLTNGAASRDTGGGRRRSDTEARHSAASGHSWDAARSNPRGLARDARSRLRCHTTDSVYTTRTQTEDGLRSWDGSGERAYRTFDNRMRRHRTAAQLVYEGGAPPMRRSGVSCDRGVLAGVWVADGRIRASS